MVPTNAEELTSAEKSVMLVVVAAVVVVVVTVVVKLARDVLTVVVVRGHPAVESGRRLLTGCIRAPIHTSKVNVRLASVPTKAPYNNITHAIVIW